MATRRQPFAHVEHFDRRAQPAVARFERCEQHPHACGFYCRAQHEFHGRPPYLECRCHHVSLDDQSRREQREEHHHLAVEQCAADIFCPYPFVQPESGSNGVGKQFAFVLAKRSADPELGVGDSVSRLNFLPVVLRSLPERCLPSKSVIRWPSSSEFPRRELRQWHEQRCGGSQL